MTQFELLKHAEWYPIVRFTDLKAVSENEINFLKHIRIFFQAKEAGLILPSGYLLPELYVEKTGAYIGAAYIIDLSIVVDRPLNPDTNCHYSDGMIIAHKVQTGPSV